MTYFKAHDMTQEKQAAFVQWVADEGIDPNLVADDGRFSVHNGNVSWSSFLADETAQHGRVWDSRKGRFTKVHITKKQVNPLPEGF